jgi:hypothetical protein
LYQAKKTAALPMLALPGMCAAIVPPLAGLWGGKSKGSAGSSIGGIQVTD